MSRRSRSGGRLQSHGREVVERASPRREGASRSRDGIQGNAARACVGETQAWSRSRPRGPRGNDPPERAWAKAYVEALRALAPRYGFGFVDGWEKLGRKFWPGAQAAGYLAAYFVAGKGAKATLTENVLAGDLPRLVVFARHGTGDGGGPRPLMRTPVTGLSRRGAYGIRTRASGVGKAKAKLPPTRAGFPVVAG
jgi:hypothetical protein